MRSVLALGLCALLAAAAVTGCAKKKTISTPEGEVTVEERPGGEAKVTVEGEEGTVTFEANKGVSEKEIGLPIYPGAKAQQTGTWSAEGQGKGAVTAALTTSDSVEDVRAFYKKRLPNAKEVTAQTGDAHMVNLAVEEGNVKKMVQIMREKDATETQIVLQKMEESK